MVLSRRELLVFLGVTAGTVACGRLPFPSNPVSSIHLQDILGFRPIKGPIPLATDALPTDQQIAQYSTYTVVDDLVLPEGFTYDIIAAWGDPVGDSRFGYNNDYLAFFPTGQDTAKLAVNFEYISAVPWQQTYQQVIGKALPLAEVKAAIQAAVKANNNPDTIGLNAYALPASDPVKAQIITLCREALIDQGVGILSLKRNANGQWQHAPAPGDRRITGISGLEDGRYLKATGPAVAIFQKPTGQGYIDSLGDKIIGTMQNCAGGQTPWGTVLSAEENFQGQVPEVVYADGTSFRPETRPFNVSDEELMGLGNVFGLAGNKYGWIVEIDPTNPNDYGTKHTWLGRYRHEAVGIRVEAGKPLAFYSGCDRRGGHLYKYVSQDSVRDPKDKTNSQLLTNGVLYVAQFQPDGSGRWIPLTPRTPVAPQSPAVHSGAMLPLPQRPEGGSFKADDPAQIDAFKQQFKTLGDLYSGSPIEQQGAILIDAHLAANAAGATCTARPEDTEIGPDGSLFITFTSGGISKEDGSPDARIFKGPDGSTAYEYGWIMRLTEDNNHPAAMTFRWQMIATGGEPAGGGQGFANPDNLAFDPKGNLWMVNDMSSDKLNQAVPAGRQTRGVPMTPSNLKGIFGNNSIWYLPLSGQAAGQVCLFGIGPMDCETTGPCFTPDHKALFLSIQHPGEVNGTRQNMALNDREFAIRTINGQEFMQRRQVPIGSNWPSKQPNDPPRPAIVAIRRTNNQDLTL